MDLGPPEAAMSCTEEIVWPTLTGWAMVRCWKTGPHDIHTDSNGAPLCTTDEARFMREQHALCAAPRRWTGLIA
jgi:hypothetical protein